MTVGVDERPAAMISILEHERWPADPELAASFLWFMSTAPGDFLRTTVSEGELCTPKLVGRAAFQIALAVALSGAAQGRLWLHADPKGGQALMNWYLNLGMKVIDPQTIRVLPGYLRPRANDGRYLYLDRGASEQLYDTYSSLIRKL